MIGKVTRGRDVGGLLRYLFGPGKANEHTDPHLVASWLGVDADVLRELEPGLAGCRPEVAALAGRLALPLALYPDGVDRPVWQCSMRTAPGDRVLSDAEWAAVAREVVEKVGFAPADDPGGCRWVAVRHAQDHIHVVVVLARQDGERVDTFRDWPKVHAAARACERRFGLQTVPLPDRTATPGSTRAEVEKAARVGEAMSSRDWLTRRVRAAAAGTSSRPEFEAALHRSGVLVTWRYSQRSPGQVTGYAVARPGDLDAHGQQVRFGGSKLSPDLSLPRLQARWREVAVAGSPPGTPSGPPDRGQTLDGAERALRRIVEQNAVDPADLTGVCEVTTTLADLTEGPAGGPLTEASELPLPGRAAATWGPALRRAAGAAAAARLHRAGRPASCDHGRDPPGTAAARSPGPDRRDDPPRQRVAGSAGPGR